MKKNRQSSIPIGSVLVDVGVPISGDHVLLDNGLVVEITQPTSKVYPIIKADNIYGSFGLSGVVIPEGYERDIPSSTYYIGSPNIDLYFRYPTPQELILMGDGKVKRAGNFQDRAIILRRSKTRKRFLVIPDHKLPKDGQPVVVSWFDENGKETMITDWIIQEREI